MVLTGQESIRDVLLFPAMRPMHDTHPDAIAELSGSPGPEIPPEPGVKPSRTSS